MEATTDIWEIPPESATRVGHPAPFPVELPLRLMHLYTYRGDLVLDPFMGSGSTAIAAIRSDRHFIGYDTDDQYVRDALERIAQETKRMTSGKQGRLDLRSVIIPATRENDSDEIDFQARAVKEGQKAKEIAKIVLRDCGFSEIDEGRRVRGGVEINFIARDLKGNRWYFDVSGAFSSTRAGLRRTDSIWKALGKAAVLKTSNGSKRIPFILLSTDLPPKTSAGFVALQSARGQIYFDAIEMLSQAGQERLRIYAQGNTDQPIGELLASDDEL